MKPTKTLSALLLALAMIGCGSGADGDYGTTREAPTAEDAEAEIARIQNDPDMPQQAKDIAIGQIRSRQENAQQVGEAVRQGGGDD